MQSLATFFEDNKPLAYAAVVAAVVVLIFVVFALYRLLFGRRLRAAVNGRTRQPRLGIVDAYDLDRQRQLVLVRRDNVEHLLMIGGTTDVVVESSIVRSHAAGVPRDKEAVGSLVGTVTSPSAIPAAPPTALGAPSPAAALPVPAPSLPAVTARSEVNPSPRGDPAVARNEPSMRNDGGGAGRTEPALAIPMPSPSPERAPAERAQPRPLAVPDPAALAVNPTPQPMRPAPARPAGLPPRPANNSVPGSAPTQTSGADRPDPSRQPLPSRPPTTRPPLPPRPSFSSGLPPRPPRSTTLVRTDPPPRAEAGRPEGVDTPSPEPATTPPETEVRTARVPESTLARGGAPSGPAPSVAPAPPPVPAKNVETLESLEEEMAKLLGRPTPRRDG